MKTKKIIQWLLISSVLLGAYVQAETVIDHLTDSGNKYAGPTVEDNVAKMDTDKNGFADASEVRAFLELIHGKGYERELLDKFEASVKGTSCGTPFANKLYN